MARLSERKFFEVLGAEDNSPDLCLVQETVGHYGIDHPLLVFNGIQGINFTHRSKPDRKRSGRLEDMHLPIRGPEEIVKECRSPERHKQIPLVIITRAMPPLRRKNDGI